MNNSHTPNIDNEVAVIGLACRFPGAANQHEFWQNLKEGKETNTFFTDEELSEAGVPEHFIYHPSYIKVRGVIPNVDKFDHLFFGFSPYEASITDPQHRIFLELCWTALEDAGYVASKTDALIGVYAGMGESSYLQNCLLKNKNFSSQNLPYQTHIANSGHFLATKISYYLNLKGPSLNIQTGCSTSLVAIIEACDSLLLGKCDIALAGGISIRLPQIQGYLYQEGGILSKDGHCRAFDRDATGTVSSNGGGVVVLKRLKDALADRDHIYGVVQSYAVNNDGHTKASFTAPSVIEQARCIATALKTIEVETLSYVETHGTGTLLGDPIEINALSKAFRYYTKEKQFCAIGSVKTNIGHTDAAAGVAGFIKTVLSLRKNFIPASLNYHYPNPLIHFDDSPFFVNTHLTEWHTKNKRRAGVSSFGIGGTNAHLILEETPYRKPATIASQSPQLIIFSAKSEESLSRIEKTFISNLKAEEEIPALKDISYTLQVGREEFPLRKAYVCQDLQALENSLQSQNDELNNYSKQIDSKARIVFLFSGQGMLYPGIGRTLSYHCNFVQFVDDCLALLPSELANKIKNFFFCQESNLCLERFDTTTQQLALFIFEYSLAKTFLIYGIKPNAMLGHSLGEYVALCLAEALTLAETLEVLTKRAELIKRTQPGKMLSISLSAKEIHRFLTAGVSMAAINSPYSCVIAGEEEAIANIEKEINNQYKEKNKCIMLDLAYGFHSPLLDDILKEFLDYLSYYQFRPSKINYLSNVTGDWISNTDLTPEYFVNHLRKTVLFSSSAFQLGDESTIYFEIGAGRVLSTFIREHDFVQPQVFIPGVLSRKEYISWKEGTFPPFFEQTIAKAWVNHVKINWQKYANFDTKSRKSLSTYAFDPHEHWLTLNDSSKNHNESQGLQIYVPYFDLIGEEESTISTSGHWLVFADNENCAEDIISKLNIDENQVTFIYPGKEFSQQAKNKIILQPREEFDYQHLYNLLKSEDSLPSNILYCWALTNNASVSLSSEDYFLSLAFFSKVFSTREKKTYHIIILLNHLFKVKRREAILPNKAVLMGLSLVLMQEFDVRCHLVDTDMLNNTSRDNDSKNFLISSNFEPVNLISVNRQGLNARLRYKRLRENKQKNQYLHPEGTYLLVGGLGKIGMELAKWLAKKYRAHLILISRTIPHDWERLKGRSLTEGLSGLEYNITYLSHHAASLQLIDANIADSGQVNELIENLSLQFSEITGIFHLAGEATISEKKLINEIDVSACHKQFLPKIVGTQQIARIAEHIPVKFCVLFSSISTILGGVTLSAYAAANCYLNAFATSQQHNKRTRWLSIAWDTWDIGREEHADSVIKGRRISVAEALHSLRICLQDEHNFQYVVLKNNLEDEIYSNLIFQTLKKNNNIAENLSKAPRDECNVEEQLIKLFQQTLGIRKFNLDSNFYDLGGTSLMVIILLESIEQLFNVRLKIADLISNLTVNKLKSLLLQKIESTHYYVELAAPTKRENLFLIHPVGGMIICFFELAKHLKDERGCFAIQDPGLDSEWNFTDLREMASEYLRQIRKIQPQGPYLIGGYSFGGSVAYEIGHQLEAAKQKLIGIILIDSWATFSDEFKELRRFREVMNKTIDELSLQMIEKMPSKEKVLTLAWNRMNLLVDYKPPEVDAQVYLFKAETLLQEYQAIEDSTNYWQDYTKRPVIVKKISGDHKTILDNQGALEIARVINSL